MLYNFYSLNSFYSLEYGLSWCISRIMIWKIPLDCYHHNNLCTIPRWQLWDSIFIFQWDAIFLFYIHYFSFHRCMIMTQITKIFPHNTNKTYFNIKLYLVPPPVYISNRDVNGTNCLSQSLYAGLYEKVNPKEHEQRQVVWGRGERRAKVRMHHQARCFFVLRGKPAQSD